MSNETNTEMTFTQTAVDVRENDVPAKLLKRQPGLGRLNRSIKATQELLAANGHVGKRFKRDYATGTATYTCPHCKATATIKLESGRGQVTVQGDALTLKCSVVNS